MQDEIYTQIKKLFNYKCNLKHEGVQYEFICDLEKKLNTRFPSDYKKFLFYTNGGTFFETEEFFSITPIETPDISIETALRDYAPLMSSIGLANPIPIHNGLSFHILSDDKFYEIDVDSGKVRKVLDGFGELLKEVIDEYKFHYEEYIPTISEKERRENMELRLKKDIKGFKSTE